MPTLELLAASLLFYIAGGFVSLLLGKTERLAILGASLGAFVAALLGVDAAVPVLIGGDTSLFEVVGPFSFAHFSLRFDPLAALMVFVISIVTVATSIYAVSYLEEYSGKGVGAIGFFMNLFIASMVMVALVDNALYFVLFWEAMTLASYFLVIVHQDDESIEAGFLYFFIAHGFSMLMMVAFLLLYMQTGSLEFASFRGIHLPDRLASTVFLLAFFGFGAKAGIMPLHIWLPRAHPAAPSHASALMSGVMIKLGIYGIIRVGVDFLGATTAWWGWLVLAFGCVSAVLGVLYALAEHDIKRLLAYHSVENIGIILMGAGIGMVGMASGKPLLTSIGLLAALYHLLNHATFKSLLFLGAGAVLHRIPTRDMNAMGGLGRRMPLTAFFFLIGALAISAIPPLNGFVSEWFTYQGLFSAATQSEFASRLLGPLGAVMLAATGALALMCFVKTWGMVFGGAPRSSHAVEAVEVPKTMLAGMALLAALCVLFGLGAPLIAPVLGHVVATLTAGQTVPVAQGLSVFPGVARQAVLSTSVIALLMAGLLAIPLAVAAFHRRRVRARISANAWACGYEHTPQMVVSAGGFAEPLRVMFRGLYLLRTSAGPVGDAGDTALRDMTLLAARTEPMWDRASVGFSSRSVDLLGRSVQIFQSGDLRLYCLYILVALAAVLLAVTW